MRALVEWETIGSLDPDTVDKSGEKGEEEEKKNLFPQKRGELLEILLDYVSEIELDGVKEDDSRKELLESRKK